MGQRERFPQLGADDTLPAATNLDAASRVPPVYTRSWFHTGTFDARAGGSTGAAIPLGLTGAEQREACRALRGSLLREELYALDGSSKEPHPYTVTEQRFSVERLQPRAGNRHAVFFTHSREVVNRHHERDPADPRISHSITLQVDEFGNVLKSLAIGYGRVASPLADPGDQKRQTTAAITMTESVMTNAIADATGYLDDHRAPLPADTCTYELTGFDPENGADHFSFEEWSRNQFARITGAAELLYEQAPTQGVEQKRLIEQVRTRYRKDNLSGLASLGTLEPRALPGDSFKLALTPA